MKLIPKHYCLCFSDPCQCRWCECGNVAHGFCSHVHVVVNVGCEVLRITTTAEQYRTHEPITPVRVVSAAECVCRRGATFCSCTRCRGCRAVIDAADCGHVCPGLRESTLQERRAWRCTSVNPETGDKCVEWGTHSGH